MPNPPHAPRPTQQDLQGTVRIRRARPLAAGTRSRCDLRSTRVIHCGAREAAIAAHQAEALEEIETDFDDVSDYTLVDAPVFLDVEWS